MGLCGWRTCHCYVVRWQKCVLLSLSHSATVMCLCVSQHSFGSRGSLADVRGVCLSAVDSECSEVGSVCNNECSCAHTIVALIHPFPYKFV